MINVSPFSISLGASVGASDSNTFTSTNTFTGPTVFSNTMTQGAFLFTSGGTVRATGSTAAASGVGAEMDWTGATARLLGYNRGTSAFVPMTIDGSLVSIQVNGGIKVQASSTAFLASVPVTFASYTIATLPAAASFTRGQIWVSDMAGGAQYAYSDGTNWRRVSDLTVAS